MDVEEAKKILDDCDRRELRDHAFGDKEISWEHAGFEVAYGYSTGREWGVHFIIGESFEGEEAHKLTKCGTLVTAERNDSTGPDEFILGRIQPGLTRQAVQQELQMKQHMFRHRSVEEFRHNGDN